MSFQYLIVGLIILFAATYVGINVWRKIKAFSPKSSSCGNDCGCGTKTKSKVQI